MEKELSTESKEISLKQLIIVCLIGCVAAGLSIGYLIGGGIMQSKWEDYIENYEAQIEKDCLCLEKADVQTGWGLVDEG